MNSFFNSVRDWAVSLLWYKWVSGTIPRIVYLGLEVDGGGHGGDILCRRVAGSCHQALFAVRSDLQLRNLIWITLVLCDPNFFLVGPFVGPTLFSWLLDNWGPTLDYWYE